MLIIAEKPKVAEKIARFLDSNAKKEYENKVPYYVISVGGKRAFVASAVGHVYSLREKQKSSKIPAFDVEWAPIYEVSRNAAYVKGYVKNIQKLAKKVDVVVSACDYDIEGSLIGYNAIRFAAGKKSGKRMKFSALTKNDIVSAFKNMGELDYNNALAGETRHILDWYWGINLSRALMSAIRKAGMYKILSIGRVQGPALDILVKREKEIASFVPKPYWTLHIEANSVKYAHENGKFWDEASANSAYERTDKKGIVEEVKKKMFKVAPPPPFDLTSLQIEAYGAYKMSPKEVLQLAQNLYENSYISYPRTSSQKLPASLGLKNILQKLSKIKQYKEIAEDLLKNNKTKPNEGKKTDPAHPAIHPTGIYGKMSEREEKLYDLIVRRFIACFCKPAIKESTTAALRMGKEKYIGNGMHIKEPGWIRAYGRYYKQDEAVLPELKKGDKFKADSIKKEKKMTQPPKRYTPTSLVKVLEKKNLGTKATRATIIDTLFKRDYLNAKSIQVTNLGMAVHDVLEKYCPAILDEKLTRSFEEKVAKIQEGKLNEEDVLKKARDILTEIIREFGKNEGKIGEGLLRAFKKSEEKRNFIMKCDKCGGDLVVKRTRDGRIFIGCTGYPNCRNAYPIPSSVKKVTFVKKCGECGGPIVKYRIGKKTVERCLNVSCPN